MATECRIPDGMWVQVEMTDGIGSLADGHWRLKITGDDGPLFAQEDVACDADFASIQWLGIVSYGTEPCTFYIADMQLRQLEQGQ